MRIHHIVPHGEFTHTLKDILVFETDLFEFVTRSKVNRVFADFSGEVYTNCIMSSESNVKVSMEVGFSPDGSQPVLLHEVVARTGVASDLPVDTQMVQYPIYVLKGGETEVYNEIALWHEQYAGRLHQVYDLGSIRYQSHQNSMCRLSTCGKGV